MVIVRNIFQINAGSMKQAISVFQQGRALMAKSGGPKSRILVDVVGEFYTLVFEVEHASLAEFEQGFGGNMASEEWQAWYKELTPLVASGRREVMRVVE